MVSIQKEQLRISTVGKRMIKIHTFKLPRYRWDKGYKGCSLGNVILQNGSIEIILTIFFLLHPPFFLTILLFINFSLMIWFDFSISSLRFLMFIMSNNHFLRITEWIWMAVYTGLEVQRIWPGYAIIYRNICFKES